MTITSRPIRPRSMWTLIVQSPSKSHSFNKTVINHHLSSGPHLPLILSIIQTNWWSCGKKIFVSRENWMLNANCTNSSWILSTMNSLQILKFSSNHVMKNKQSYWRGSSISMKNNWGRCEIRWTSKEYTLRRRLLKHRMRDKSWNCNIRELWTRWRRR